MSKEKEIMYFWSQEAEQWRNHSILGPRRDPIMSVIRDTILPHLDHVPLDGTILDLGSGSGNNEYFTARSRQKIISADISTEMLRLNPSRDRIQMNLTDGLPFRCESVDFCTTIFTMRYITYRNHVTLLEEIERVLKIGGIFLIIDLPSNNYPHQYSVFEPDKLAPIASALGFESVATDSIEVFYSMPERSGFGDSAPIAATLNVLSGVKKHLPNGWAGKKIVERYIVDNEGDNEELRCGRQITF